MISENRLADWLKYADLDAHLTSMIGGDYIVTDSFTYRASGDPSSSIWEMEEWSIASVLVPKDRLEDATQLLTIHDILIEPHWLDRDRFDFGESTEVKGIPIKRWSFMRDHPANGMAIVELQRDFQMYHTLDRRGIGDEYQFVHPLDNLEVVRIRIQKHEFYKPTLRLEVHRDYLRDFLAAYGHGLLIGVVADRFRHSSNPDWMTPALAGSTLDVEVMVNEMFDQEDQYWRARAILHKAVAVQPYTHPKPERSGWHCYDSEPTLRPTPEFIIDSEGQRGTLDVAPAYLFFKPGVLRKFVKNPNDSAFFHMRTWGSARPAGSTEAIDVGINSSGLVNAFSGDLSKQNHSEQLYWASFSCLPSGGICEELFQTRMQQNPPNSPSTVELFQVALKGLNDSYLARFGEAVHGDAAPDKKMLQRVSVGPLEENWDELAELAKDLCSWVIEGLSVKVLRKPLDTSAYEPEWKQLKLLEVLLSHQLGCEPSDTAKVVGPLKDLNALRIGNAHNVSLKKLQHFDIAGRRVREAWFIVVDHVAGGLDLLAGHLRAPSNAS